MGDFEKLKVWELSKNLTVEVYNAIEKSESIRSDWAVSIPSNLNLVPYSFNQSKSI